MEPLSSMKLATIAIATPGCVLNSFYQFKLPVPDGRRTLRRPVPHGE